MKALLERLGWPGIAGIGLMLFSLSFYVGELSPALQALVDLQNEQAQLQARRQTSSPASRPFAPTTLADSPRLLARISRLAEENGVRIARTISQIEDSEGVQRLAIRLPIRAAYPALRHFLQALSSQLPGLAVDEISLSRNQASEDSIEADVHLSVTLSRST